MIPGWIEVPRHPNAWVSEHGAFVQRRTRGYYASDSAKPRRGCTRVGPFKTFDDAASCAAVTYGGHVKPKHWWSDATDMPPDCGNYWDKVWSMAKIPSVVRDRASQHFYVLIDNRSVSRAHDLGPFKSLVAAQLIAEIIA
jgi:hypothetical protein